MPSGGATYLPSQLRGARRKGSPRWDEDKLPRNFCTSLLNFRWRLQFSKERGCPDSLTHHNETFGEPDVYRWSNHLLLLRGRCQDLHGTSKSMIICIIMADYHISNHIVTFLSVFRQNREQNAEKRSRSMCVNPESGWLFEYFCICYSTLPSARGIHLPQSHGGGLLHHYLYKDSQEKRAVKKQNSLAAPQPEDLRWKTIGRKSVLSPH